MATPVTDCTGVAPTRIGPTSVAAAVAGLSVYSCEFGGVQRSSLEPPPAPVTAYRSPVAAAAVPGASADTSATALTASAADTARQRRETLIWSPCTVERCLPPRAPRGAGLNCGHTNAEVFGGQARRSLAEGGRTAAARLTVPCRSPPAASAW